MTQSLMAPVTRPFAQVDVFTATAGLGNPLAVVLDARGLSQASMQHLARWTNLSETAFVLPADKAQADYALRIFTPGGELPFAGHPTLGACHAWLAAGGQPRNPARIVQQCALGLIPIQRSAGLLAFAAPPCQRSAVPPALLAQTLQALGLQPGQVLRAQWLHNGPAWLALQLDSARTVLALQPNRTALTALGHKVGVAGIHPAPGAPASPLPEACAQAPANSAPALIRRSNREARAFGPAAARHAAAAHPAPTAAPDGSGEPPLLEVRAFTTPDAVEDPVTGSLNASLAQWLMAEGQLPPRYTAAQGTALHRAGRVHLWRDAQGQVWAGGHCTPVVQGHIQL